MQRQVVALFVDCWSIALFGVVVLATVAFSTCNMVLISEQ